MAAWLWHWPWHFTVCVATGFPGGSPSIPWQWACRWAVGHVRGRVGCFMAGCCYGKPSDWPWAVTFTDPDTLCPIKEALHPSQLYEALLLLFAFGVIYWFRTRKRFDGQLMLIYFLLAGAIRFGVEFFRHPADYRGPILFWAMPSTQVVALGIAVLSGIMLFWFWHRSESA
jgi:phosphatidylglycerol:prolipoprotein diacylglycerol transferase